MSAGLTTATIRTERGFEFLKEYKHFHERYDRAQLMLEKLESERDRLGKLCHRYGLGDSMKSIIDVE